VTASKRNWVDQFAGTAGTGQVRLSATIGANEHLRHVRVVGSQIFLPYPTNVISDNGAWMGILAVFPASAPPIPTFANAPTWRPGWWGRPVIDSVELIANPGIASGGGLRYNFHIDFDYAPDGGGVAGALYVGSAQMYVDANHVGVNTSFTVSAWGITN